MPTKTQHVVPHPNGGWAVKRGGAIRATRVFDTQAKATTYARTVSRTQGAELYIHKRDGTIRSKDSYGNDPCPPKDKC